MEHPALYSLLGLTLLLLIFFNILLSKDIYNWVPSITKQLGLYMLLWLLPVAGFLLANKLGKLGWFCKHQTSSNSSAVAGGFMEADSVFNPGTAHRIEVVEKQKSETHHEHKQARDKSK